LATAAFSLSATSPRAVSIRPSGGCAKQIVLQLSLKLSLKLSLSGPMALPTSTSCQPPVDGENAAVFLVSKHLRNSRRISRLHAQLSRAIFQPRESDMAVPSR